MTKKEQYYYSLFKNYSGRRLRDCYNKPSFEKECTYSRLLKYYNSIDNFDVLEWGVLSYNKFCFTMGFLVFDETTKERYLMVETANNHYKFKID